MSNRHQDAFNQAWDVIEAAVRMPGADGYRMAYDAFVTMKNALLAGLSDERDLAFGWGWREGHRVGLEEGWTAGSDAAAGEIADRESQLMVLRARLQTVTQRLEQLAGHESSNADTYEDENLSRDPQTH